MDTELTKCDFVLTRGEKTVSQSAGLKEGTSPDSVRQDLERVSVRYARETDKKWFVLRVSYGRYDKAEDYLTGNDITYYLPKHVVRIRTKSDGKLRKTEKPLITNMIFAYDNADSLREKLKEPGNNVLSFYYNHFECDAYGANPPLVIRYDQMLNFIIATSVPHEHMTIVTREQCRFKSGDIVEVTEGDFAGVEGRVARAAGQQRVIIELTGLCLVATAFIPTAYLRIKDKTAK